MLFNKRMSIALPIGATVAHGMKLNLYDRAALTVPILEMNYPPSRGLNLATATIGPCGGYSPGGRIPYPISGGQLSTAQNRDANDFQWAYSTTDDPQLVSDFKPLMDNTTILYSGTSCWNAPDLTSLGLSVGDNITIKAEFHSGPTDTRYHECADLTLISVEAYTKPDYTCANIVTSTKTTANGTSTASTSSSATPTYGVCGTNRGNCSISSVASGAIGASVTLALAFLILILAWLTGYAAFGKKRIDRWKNQEMLMLSDRASDVGSVGTTTMKRLIGRR
ncbi:hypothetical protein [Phaffia rhodozyma]|uniref:Copper acquisition factor BIM1-like domain-containing protein n=1 Tax=Phaffia rhodozyma TaxID=264483 RepID=A0A0F7SPV2_PHARH|nr:hypothetical protein [Phaffia rhodozyma]